VFKHLHYSDANRTHAHSDLSGDVVQGTERLLCCMSSVN
jgi:hypothetical protein